MARRLPSLNALRAFEAAARHESMTEAAGELFVTHAAVSRHIRELEEWLGVPLFLRTGRGVKLTEAGRDYARELTALFDSLAQATRDLMARGDVRRLAVTVDPSFASRWLVPRLGRFNALHPDIELEIDPNATLVDFHAGGFDLGIRTGGGRWDGLEAVEIAKFFVFPVCAPKLIAGHTLGSPADLGDFTLLHTYSREWWVDWLEAAGVEGVDGRRGPFFQNHLAIEAAEAGQGFALGDHVLTTDSLVEGWLVRPFQTDVKEPGGYFLVRLAGAKETVPQRAFREWLLAEMAETNRAFASIAKGERPTAAPAVSALT